MRTSILFLFLVVVVHADVLVLKDGRKVAGKIVEKGGHFEVATEGGLKTFLKDEVEKTIAAHGELLGDAEKLLEEAKKEYLAAVDIKDPAQQTAKLKEAAAKLTKVREAYSGARELFWEDKYVDLDLKLVQVVQLMRLLRERMGSELARSPAAPPPPPKPAAPPPPPAAPAAVTLQDAVAVAVDPSKRADGARRLAAQAAVRAGRREFAGGADLATSMLVFLTRADKEWKLEGPALAAAQEYFAKPWLSDPSKLTPAAHLEAAKFLAEKSAAVKKAGGSTEALALFAAGHLGSASTGPDLEKAATAAGFVVREGVIGTAEGHATYDLVAWIGRGDFDLAGLAYVKEWKGGAGDTPAVRFLWAYALIRQSQIRKRQYDRPAKALDAVAAVEVPVKDHAAALAKSVRNVSVCSTCSGEGKIRCTNCQGKKEFRIDCTKCNGVGATRTGGALASCGACKGRGYDKLGRCNRCKDGYPECPSCDKRPRTPPEMDDICAGAACGTCDGEGLLFRKVLVPCRSCLGLGQKLTPRADPSKVLP